MRTLMGGILLAVGILIAGASGLCSLVVFISSASDPASMGDMVLLILLFGGVPLAIGVGLIFGGRALIRAGRNENGSA